MSESKPAEMIPVGNKGNVIVNPAEMPVIDLSNGAQGIKEDMYNAGGTGAVHKGAPRNQDGNGKKRRKKKKKGRTSSGSY